MKRAFFHNSSASHWKRLPDRFWSSPRYFPLLTALAALFLLSDQILSGLGALLLIGSLFLVFCEDLFSALYPFLLLMLLSTRYYESNAVLFRFAWVLLFPAAALVFRLTRRRAGTGSGLFDRSLLAVSAAALLGGMGVIPAKEYLSPIGLYYTLGLGVFQLGSYRVFRSELAGRQSDPPVRRFAALLYAAGIFTALLVLDRYLPYGAYFLREWKVIHIPCRNYFAAMLLLALPAPFYFLHEDRRHSLGILLLYAAALLTGSRSALLFGTALVTLSLLRFCLRCSFLRNARRILPPLFGALSLGLILLAARTLFLSREINGQLFSMEDSRIIFLRLALQDFLAHPLTGQGLANMRHRHVFLGVTGSIVWYHNYFAQILGSMGLVGAVAYGWQLRDRLRLLRRLRGRDADFLSLSYLGIFLLSLTNPGEFSPLPAEFLVILLFTVAENSAEQQK